MDQELKKLIISEIKENRNEIKSLRAELHKMDKHVFSNKIKLSIFIAGVGLFVQIFLAIAIEKIKTIL